MSKATDQIKPLASPARAATPTEKVRAIPRPATELYHHMPAKAVTDAMTIAKKLKARITPLSIVRVERHGDAMTVKVADRTVTLTREEARELGATLLHLAR